MEKLELADGLEAPPPEADPGFTPEELPDAAEEEDRLEDGVELPDGEELEDEDADEGLDDDDDDGEDDVSAALRPPPPPGKELPAAPGRGGVEAAPATPALGALGLPAAAEEEPDFGTLAEALLPEDALPGLSATSFAFRSIVTGRLDAAPALAEGFAPLPGVSEAPPLAPPEEDVPPEDLLSVAISTPPEPFLLRFHPSLYTPLCEAVPLRPRLLRAAKQRLPRFWLRLS